MRAQLDGVATKESATRGDKQLDMGGADEIGKINVVGQAFTDVISGRIEWRLGRLIRLLSGDGAGQRKQQGDQLRDFE
jgi:hypothetical protein